MFRANLESPGSTTGAFGYGIRLTRLENFEMDVNQEVDRRKAALIEDLRDDIRFNQNWGRFYRFSSGTLLFFALLGSALAGILGLLGVIPAQWVGGIALVPTFLFGFARAFRAEEKASWYYRKKNRLADLLDQLIYQQPVNPTLEQIAAINKKKHNLNLVMQQEWDEKLRLGWSAIDHQQHPLTEERPPQTLPPAR